MLRGDDPEKHQRINASTWKPKQQEPAAAGARSKQNPEGAAVAGLLASVHFSCGVVGCSRQRARFATALEE